MLTLRPQAMVLVEQGSKVSLSCAGAGRPRPLIIWMHEQDRTFLLPGEATEHMEVSREAEIVIEAAEASANLVCIVVNEVGAELARASVVVQDASLELGFSSSNSNSEGSLHRAPLTGGVQVLCNQSGCNAPTW